MELNLKFAKKNERCSIPNKSERDAGYDLYIDPEWFERHAWEDKKYNPLYVVIKPGETLIIPSGIYSILPEGYYAQFQERGSTGIRAMKYGAGVIDESYRGEWNIPITNCNNVDIVIYNTKIDLEDIQDEHIFQSGNEGVYYPYNKAIVQFVLHEVPKTIIEEISMDEINKNTTERGAGKFGSSGK